PISLCTVYYKIIIKILVRRLQYVMPHLIKENQSAFITGRLIADKILVPHEVVHYIKSRKLGSK
ncbi:conserved hypothetical protein, partial [Ricinus communis]